jgi:HrpA-like RNA helicase
MLVITVQVDFLLAAMRTLAAARPDVKLLMMSATLNSANISEYFSGHAPGAWLEAKRARLPRHWL